MYAFFRVNKRAFSSRQFFILYTKVEKNKLVFGGKMNSDSIKDLQALVTDFINKRDWMVYHSPKNLAMSIAIEAAEIMELFQWITNVEADQQVKNDPGFVNELSYEIADVIIYCLSICNR